MNTYEDLCDLDTETLYEEILRLVEIQKRNPPDTLIATEARRANRPLMAEMATRSDAPPVK